MGPKRQKNFCTLEGKIFHRHQRLPSMFQEKHCQSLNGNGRISIQNQTRRGIGEYAIINGCAFGHVSRSLGFLE